MTSPTYLRRPLRRRENHRASKEKTCPYNDIVYESDGDTEVQYYTSDESVDGSGGRKTQRRTLAESMVKAKQRGVTAARRGHDTLRRRGRESVNNLKQRGRSGVDGVRRRSKSLVARAPADRSGPSSGRRRSTFKVSSVISGKPLPQASAFGRKKEKKVKCTEDWRNNKSSSTKSKTKSKSSKKPQSRSSDQDNVPRTRSSQSHSSNQNNVPRTRSSQSRF